jgi:hypothetical protein
VILAAQHRALTGAYSTTFAGSLIALRARGHQLPGRPTAADLLLVDVATPDLRKRD